MLIRSDQSDNMHPVSGNTIKSKKDAINSTINRINNGYFGFRFDTVQPSRLGSHHDSFQTVMTSIIQTVNRKLQSTVLPLGQEQRYRLGTLLSELNGHINTILKEGDKGNTIRHISRDLSTLIQTLQTPLTPSPSMHSLQNEILSRPPVPKKEMPKPLVTDAFRDANMALDNAVLRFSHSSDAPTSNMAYPIFDSVVASVDSNRTIHDILKPLNPSKMLDLNHMFNLWTAENLLKQPTRHLAIATSRLESYFNERQTQSLLNNMKEAPGPKGKDYSAEELRKELITKDPRQLNLFIRNLKLNNRLDMYKPTIEQRFHALTNLQKNPHTTLPEKKVYKALADVLYQHLYS